MKLEVVSLFRNYKLDRTETVVTCLLSSESGDSGTLTVVCEGDLKNLSNEDLVLKVKDKIYDRLFPARAEKEAIAKIKSEINTLKEEALKEIKEETEKNRDMVKAITLIVNQYLMSHEEELEEEDDDTGSSDDSEGSEEENRAEEEGSDSNDN